MDKPEQVCSVMEYVKMIDVEHVACVGTDNIEVNRVLEDGGSCNGVDIAVAVSGSKVNGDAFFGHDGLNKEGSERGSYGLDREEGAFVLSGFQGISDSGARVMNSAAAIEHDVGGYSTGADSFAKAKPEESQEERESADDRVEKGEVSGDGGGSNIADNRTSEDTRVKDVETWSTGAADGGERSPAFEASADGKILVKDVVVMSKEESLSGELVNGVENGRIKSENANSNEVGVSKSERQDQIVENAARESSTAIVGSTAFENKVSVVVEKSVVIDDAKRQEGMEVDLEAQKVDVFHDEVTNYGTETTISTPSTVTESSSVETKVVEQDHTLLANNESASHKVQASSVDPIEGTISPAITCNPEIDSIFIEKAGTASAMSETLDKQTQVTCDENPSPMDQNEVVYSEIEGMDSYAFDEKFCFSLEELQATGETDSWSTENHYNEFADLQSSPQPIQVAEGEESTSENQAPVSSGQIDLNVAIDMGVVGQQITDSAHAGLQIGQMESVAGHHIKVQTGNGSTYSCRIECLDSSCHSTQGISAEFGDDRLNDSKHLETADDNSDKPTALRSVSTINEHQASYRLPHDDKSKFSVSDMVWGKVKSHPWWPGQIFHSSYASEKAIKHQKKDCYLVAYFGDGTFAWNEASQLMSFRSLFSQVEKQSSTESFQNAVDCALEEVSRRVELGLSCSCTPKGVYDEIKFQMVENAGIQEEFSSIEVVDISVGTGLFEPANLVDYMKELAQSPCAAADRLELTIARSQLLAFYRLKGYTELPEYQYFEDLLENVDMVDSEDASPVFGDNEETLSDQEEKQRLPYRKRKHNMTEGVFATKKERSLTELMDNSRDSVNGSMGYDENTNGKLISPSSRKKRKISDPFADESTSSDGRKTISLAKVSTAAAPFCKPSFKIGECIRRVASQMTGSLSILKHNNPKSDSVDRAFGEGTDTSFRRTEEVAIKKAIDPTESSSLLLSHLHLAAQNPLKGYSFSNVIINFFSGFRNSVIVDQHDKIGSKKRKSPGSSPVTFEFEDMSDTYWIDRVIENGGDEEHSSRKSVKRDTFVPISQKKTPNGSAPRNRYSESSNNQPAERRAGYVDENAPAELVMHFPVADSVPSELSLNKMFRRFGPIKESQTEVDWDTNRARVVFKKRVDADAAHGSASKYNIFGRMLVNYQLNYAITTPFKSVPVAATLSMEDDESIFLDFNCR